MATRTDGNPLNNHKASPRAVAEAINALVKPLYNNEHLEECARQCYTADVKMWTDQKQLVSGTDQLITYLKEAFKSGAKIGEVTIEEAMNVGDKHIIAKCKCDFGCEYHYMSLYRFDNDGQWRIEWDVDYM